MEKIINDPCFKSLYSKWLKNLGEPMCDVCWGKYSREEVFFVVAKYLKAKKVFVSRVMNTGLKQALKKRGVKLTTKKHAELEINDNGEITIKKYITVSDERLAKIIFRNAIKEGVNAKGYKPFFYFSAEFKNKPNKDALKKFLFEAEDVLAATGRILVVKNKIIVEGTNEKLCEAVLKSAESELGVESEASARSVGDEAVQT